MNKRVGHLALLLPSVWAATLIGTAPAALAQQPDEARGVPAGREITSMRSEQCDVGCACCHNCDRPTPEDPCLPPCGRDPGLYMRGQKGPDVVVLDELQDAYLPVPFDHKGHAEMAEMTRGCVICHHYTPEGQQHPACKTCHEVDVTGTGIRKPGLKGAYHRQCLNCHKDWIDPSDCGICHRRRTSGPRIRDEVIPTTDDILGRMHPPITEPETEIYRAQSKEGAKSVVVFRHWEHVHGFGLRCVECHHEENCTRCHLRNNGEEQTRTVNEHHQPCLLCHRADMGDGDNTAITERCRRCHWQEGQPKIQPFDHAHTGWPLSRYHEGNTCRDCHQKVPFVRQSTDCNDCHEDWAADHFEHAITGQILNDNHRTIDCADCHIDRRFDVPPRCDECHDEDDGIRFPEQRPGQTVVPRAGEQG